MKPHVLYDDIEPDRVLAYIHGASKDTVQTVLNAPVETGDGRSEWVWVRLPNGVLILGTFPQGDTYFEVEYDSAFPSEGLK